MTQTALADLPEELPPTPCRDWVQSLVQHPYFDISIMGLILVNALILGIQTDWMARTLSTEEPTIFKVCERLFCAFFVFELSMRIFAYGCSLFTDSQWHWNLLDLFVVGTQLFDLFFDEVLGRVLSGDELRANVSFVRILRVVRLLRIIRVLRTFRTISELRSIVVCIFGTVRTLLWTLFLLFVVIFMFAAMLTQIVANHLVNAAEPGNSGRTELDKYWGSLGSSILVLFQAVTNGVDWHDILQPLMEHISPWLAVPVVMYIGFGTFALMNIVTGVFVESALESGRLEKERFLLHTVKRLFRTTDEDDSGDISWEEFRAKLGTPAMQVYFKTIDLDIQEAEDLFHLIDINQSGSIDPEEFVNGCIRLQGPAKALDLATLMHEFKRSQNAQKLRHRGVVCALNKQRAAMEQDPSQNEESQPDVVGGFNHGSIHHSTV